MGAYADFNNTNRSRCTFIGAGGATSGIMGGRIMVLGDDATTLGYSTESQVRAISIGSDAHASSDGAISVGYIGRVTGNNSIGIGRQIVINGTESIGLGRAVSLTGNNSIVIGSQQTLTADNEVYLGNATTASIGGTVNWTATSDGRFKTNVTENVPGLDFIESLRPVTYNFDIDALQSFTNGAELPEELQEAGAEKATVQYSGFIAQEVERAAQNLGYDFSGVKIPENPETQAYGLRYAEFVVPLVKSVQELNNLVESQAEELASQQTINEEYEARISELEAQNQAINQQYEARVMEMEQRMQQLEALFMQREQLNASVDKSDQ